MTIIPLQASIGSQTFRVDLEGNTYNFRVIFNTRLQTWTMDISNEEGDQLCSGVTMVIGSDMIDQFNLNIGGMFMVEEGNTNLDATYEDLGTRVLLIHLTEEEIDVVSAV